MSSVATQTLVQARDWLRQRLGQLGGAPVLVGVDIAQMAANGRVGYGLRIIAKPEGISWLQQFGFPGVLETPHGKVYVAVLQAAAQGQPGAQAAAADPYAGWSVKVSGTDLRDATIKYSGTDLSTIQGPAKISGTEGVPPAAGKGGEFKIRSGAFGTTFPGFGED